MAADSEEGAGRVTHLHLPTDVRRQWYAVALGKDLPAPISGKLGMKAPLPLSTSLLGDPIVLWRDRGGLARCVADKCPHRSAPLSLGRVNGDTGSLECIYHGWQMEGECGQVTVIPALLDGSRIPPNARVRTYCVCEQDGVVYVWAGESSDAVAAEKPPRDMTDDGKLLVEPENGFVVQLMCFDLPIGHELMLENLLDPAHIPFAHEGTIGKRKQAESLNMKMIKTPRGFKGIVKDGYYNAFEAPCTVVLHTPPVPGKMDMYQYFACTPSAPGHMRMVYRAYRNFAKWIDRIPPLRRIFDGFSNKIIFQDYILLLGQQQRLREGALAWNSTIQVDILPLTYRKYWQRTFGNLSADGPWWRGWDGSLDVEELHRFSGLDKDFDCNGCALPRRPHHPKNSLEESGRPAQAMRPQPPPSAWREWAPLVASSLALVLAAAALTRARQR